MYFVSVCFPEFIFLLLKPIFILLLMPANRNALIRYKTIDNCLRNPYRRWTLEDLMDACSDALYEYEGIRNDYERRMRPICAGYTGMLQTCQGRFL